MLRISRQLRLNIYAGFGEPLCALLLSLKGSAHWYHISDSSIRFFPVLGANRLMLNILQNVRIMIEVLGPYA
jgi:hypothetical protein